MLRPTIIRQSALVSSPIWGPRSDYYCQTAVGLLMWGALSDKITGLSFTTVAGPHQRSHSRVRVPRTVSGSKHPNLEGQVPVFISERNKVAHLYPRVLGSLFVA
jgi:hypothetical protein